MYVIYAYFAILSSFYCYYLGGLCKYNCFWNGGSCAPEFPSFTIFDSGESHTI